MINGCNNLIDAMTIKQPKSLQDLLCEQMITWIYKKMTLFLDKNISHKVKQIKKYLQYLPFNIQSKLLKKALVLYEYPSTNHSAVTFLIDMLISPRVKEFSFTGTHFLPRQNLEALLNVIAKQEIALKTFALLETVFVLRFAILQLDEGYHAVNKKIIYLLNSIVVKHCYLSHLGLHSICTDNILAVIGENCHQLKLLDISFSKVTNNGLYFLTQIMECCSSEDQDKLESNNCNLLSFLPARIKNRKKPCLLVSEEPSHKCSFVRHKTKLCYTLKFAYFFETNITVSGFNMFLCLTSSIEYAGWDKFQYFLDDLYADYQEATIRNKEFVFPDLNLRILFIWNLTSSRVKVLASTCRSATDLMCEMVSCSLSELSNIPNISKLNVNFHPKLSLEMLTNGFTEYITTCGSKLTELKFGRYALLIDIPLSFVLKYCCNLETLSLNLDPVGEVLNFGNYPMEINRLRHIKISMSIRALDVKTLLENAPCLESVSFRSVIGREEFLLSLCDSSTTISKKLTCFIIEEGGVLRNPNVVAIFCRCNKQLRTLGYVNYTIEDLHLEGNVELDLVRHIVS